MLEVSWACGAWRRPVGRDAHRQQGSADSPLQLLNRISLQVRRDESGSLSNLHDWRRWHSDAIVCGRDSAQRCVGPGAFLADVADDAHTGTRHLEKVFLGACFRNQADRSRCGKRRELNLQGGIVNESETSVSSAGGCCDFLRG